ncbi:UvrD-helicase domain-containing protein [Micromonospora sp. NPDC005173]|uniref:HelD family protein n=1 Tax=Micromonospora sp. NPDC005173 TaxID=3157165 RepID=UPI0033B8C0D6
MVAESIEEVPDAAELAREQLHFDSAWLHREEMRDTASSIPQAAANSGAAAHMRRYAQARLEQLGSSDDQVAFGRIDDESGEPLYIGRHTIFDDQSKVLVVNWQAKAAIPYYEASYTDPLGLTRKRSFQCTGNTIDSFSDLVFAQLAAAVESLETGTPPVDLSDALLRDLEQVRTGEMREIVETIQAAQFELIRADANQVLIIQGGPGTGKTAVALHRVSWLLYNEHERLTPERVLVVGPSPTFTRYIRSVLPSLGDVNVDQRDIGKLAPAIRADRVEPVDLTRLKGQARMAGLLARALDHRIGVPDSGNALQVQVNKRPVALSRDTVTHVVEQVRAMNGSYNERRQILRERLLEVIRDEIRGGFGSARQSQPEGLLDRLWPPLTAASFLRELFGSGARLIAAAGDEFTAAEVAMLQRRPTDRISEERWSRADVALLDEADALINGAPASYGHIVVDEAQDLSPMQLRSIARRSATGSMTVVGDIAQSTGLWSRDGWDEVLEHLPATLPHQIRDLRFGYRVPRQVFELAARLLPQAAPFVEPPQVVRDGPAPEVHRTEVDERAERVVEVATRHAGKGRFVGIVCPDTCREAILQRLDGDEVKWSDGRDGQLGQSINLTSPTEAKGLEFDAVIVVEPEEIVSGDPRGHRMLYVALTRTTTHLDIVYSGNPVAGLFGDDGGDTGEEQRPAARPAVTVPAQTRTGGSNPLSEMVTEMLAKEIAGQIRDACPEKLWDPVLTRVAELLGHAPAAPEAR